MQIDISSIEFFDWFCAIIRKNSKIPNKNVLFERIFTKQNNQTEEFVTEIVFSLFNIEGFDSSDFSSFSCYISRVCWKSLLKFAPICEKTSLSTDFFQLLQKKPQTVFFVNVLRIKLLSKKSPSVLKLKHDEKVFVPVVASDTMPRLPNSEILPTKKLYSTTQKLGGSWIYWKKFLIKHFKTNLNEAGQRNVNEAIFTA